MGWFWCQLTLSLWALLHLAHEACSNCRHHHYQCWNHWNFLKASAKLVQNSLSLDFSAWFALYSLPVVSALVYELVQTVGECSNWSFQRLICYQSWVLLLQFNSVCQQGCKLNHSCLIQVYRAIESHLRLKKSNDS